jgi:hypothetical protein
MKVDWTKWAAVAEILGAIAIVVTLLYLAMQTRYLAIQTEQNTQALNAQLGSNRVAARAAVYDLALLATEFRMASPRIYVNLRSSAPLSIEEEGELDGYMSTFWVAREFVWLQYQDGSLDQATFETMMADVSYLSIPKMREWWDQNKERVFEADFIEYIDSRRN